MSAPPSGTSDYRFGSSSSDIPARLAAALADRYALERELGRGGMATVYLAEDVRHHRQVAIKVLHPELGAVLGADRFLREIGIAARLNHPHILPLHDSGTLDLGLGRPVLFYAMPYVANQSLRERLRKEVQLPMDEAVRIARQVADALDYAHRQGVIHRDIKPENILLADGQAVLADFGIARALDVAAGDRLTETGLSIGTPAYMSPEQSAGTTRLDGRSDIYALGCVLYEVLGGQPPFSGPSPQAILARHAIDPVPSLRTLRPTVPRALGLVVTRSLAKVPADRFPTARAFSEALAEAAVAPTSLGHDTATMAVEARRIADRRRWLLLGAAVIAVLTLGIVYGLRRSASVALPNPKLVAILPFRVAGANPELAWLRDGMIDLLAIKLTGEEGLRAAEPQAVLSAWRRVGGSETKEITPEAELEIARRLGAGRIIHGGVVGTSRHLTLTAALLTSPGSRAAARAGVEGPADSLPVLVDRLAARLLSLDAGVDAARLSMTSVSLPAIRAYLAGRAAFRIGRADEAVRQFREATRLDSTFALAALELVHASIWLPPSDEAERDKRLAWAGRERLSPADRVLLDAWAGPTPTGPELFQRWQAATSAYPDRSETWYGLGDAYFHFGMLVGLRLDDALRLADEAFQRGWALDSASAGDSLAPGHSPSIAEPLTHMVEIARLREDTTSVRRLVALGLAADSTWWQGPYLRWHRAMALGDSALRVYWAEDPGAFWAISSFLTHTGIGSQADLRAVNLVMRKEASDSTTIGALALNGGRPREALRFLHGDDTPTSNLRVQIGQALYWGGDTSMAVRAAHRLAPYAVGTTARDEAPGTRLRSLCVLATWRAARGDYQYTGAAIRRLRGTIVAGLPSNDSIQLAQYTALCADLLDATRATALHLTDARTKLAQADSAARTYIKVVLPPPNLVVAQLAEMQGDLPLALRAVRRRVNGFGLFPWYFSTFLHEEGRLAALTGDTAGAIRAYQHYLALRPNPEPEVKPEVERVRGELAHLVGEHPKR